jgi:hypothetical protein
MNVSYHLVDWIDRLLTLKRLQSDDVITTGHQPLSNLQGLLSIAKIFLSKKNSMIV